MTLSSRYSVLSSFQSTPSVGRATIWKDPQANAPLFQSTPSVGRATLCARLSRPAQKRFQSTPSVGRATGQYIDTGVKASAFQSTPSVGRATTMADADRCVCCDFNPRPPWGGRPYHRQGIQRQTNFNPRPPWGGRLGVSVGFGNKCVISIHALRGEGDSVPRRFDGRGIYFNPRPPWGGRQSGGVSNSPLSVFQSTPSVGRATVTTDTEALEYAISIHALRGEGDVKDATAAYADYISIHALRGEGDLMSDLKATQAHLISIHALRGEGDKALCSTPTAANIFQSTPSVGRATTQKRRQSGRREEISIHALRGEGDFDAL